MDRKGAFSSAREPCTLRGHLGTMPRCTQKCRQLAMTTTLLFSFCNFAVELEKNICEASGVALSTSLAVGAVIAEARELPQHRRRRPKPEP